MNDSPGHNRDLPGARVPDELEIAPGMFDVSSLGVTEVHCHAQAIFALPAAAQSFCPDPTVASGVDLAVFLGLVMRFQTVVPKIHGVPSWEHIEPLTDKVN